jgi:hypothetical protein
VMVRELYRVSVLSLLYWQAICCRICRWRLTLRILVDWLLGDGFLDKGEFYKDIEYSKA